MTEGESIRIGSIIEIPRGLHDTKAEVIGYVIGRGTKLRVRYLDTDTVELRDDLTIENTRIITY